MSWPRQLPQLAQAIGIGDHGRPGIEGEAVALPEIGAPARLVARFDDGDVNSSRLQPDRERQPAEPGTDHAGALCRHATFPKSASGLPRPVSAASAAMIGTGGLPAMMRSVSALVVRPE